MRKYFTAVSLAVLLGFTFLACTSNSPNNMIANPGASAAPVSLSIHDTPPAGVTVLRFKILITAAALQPADAMQPPVNMLPQPQDVELIHLQTESALLANRNVPSGMYTGLSATFANPQMTIWNQSMQTYTVGAQSCQPMQICVVVPALNQMSISVTSAPFPITLSASSPVAIDLHFDVNASVQGDLSVSPMVSLRQIPVPPNAPVRHMHLIGTVTSISSPTFMLQSSFDGSMSTITTDNNTNYHFDRSCPADNFSCIAVGQLLRVKVSQMSDGTLDATDVRLIQTQALPSFQGTVLSVNVAQNQVMIGLNFEHGPAADNQQAMEAASAISVTIQLSSSTTFSVDSDSLTLPSGLTFAGVQDVVVGQSLIFQPAFPLVISGTPPNIHVVVGATSVQLEPSQITAIVSAVNAQASPPNFVLGMLPPLFTGAGITQIQVDAVPGTEFEDNTTFGSLAAGQKVSVSGLLFNTPTQPTAVAVEVRIRQGDD